VLARCDEDAGVVEEVAGEWMRDSAVYSDQRTVSIASTDGFTDIAV
jgi:hypothetical protein